MTQQTPPIVAVAPPTADHDLLIEIKTLLGTYLEKDRDKELRLRALESWKWKSVGVASFISALLSGGIITAVIMLVRR